MYVYKFLIPDTLMYILQSVGQVISCHLSKWGIRRRRIQIKFWYNKFLRLEEIKSIDRTEDGQK